MSRRDRKENLTDSKHLNGSVFVNKTDFKQDLLEASVRNKLKQVMDVCLQTFLVSLRLISLLSFRRSASSLAETKERADVKKIFSGSITKLGPTSALTDYNKCYRGQEDNGCKTDLVGCFSAQALVRWVSDSASYENMQNTHSVSVNSTKTP